MEGYSFCEFTGTRSKLKLGAFYAVKCNLHAGDNYLSIRWLQWILLSDTNRSDEFQIFLAHDINKKEYVACCILQKQMWMYKPTILVSIFVSKSHRRKKIGTKLVAFAKSKSRCKNFVFFSDKKVAQKFYEKNKIPEFKF
jgi:GNAT superfamily N-acetyltransferase